MDRRAGIFGNVNFKMHLNTDGYTGDTVTPRVSSVGADDSAGTPWNDTLPRAADVAAQSVNVRSSVSAGKPVKVGVTVENNGPGGVVSGAVFMFAENAVGSVGARFTGTFDNLKCGRKSTVTSDWMCRAYPAP